MHNPFKECEEPSLLLSPGPAIYSRASEETEQIHIADSRLPTLVFQWQVLKVEINILIQDFTNLKEERYNGLQNRFVLQVDLHSMNIPKTHPSTSVD